MVRPTVGGDRRWSLEGAVSQDAAEVLAGPEIFFDLAHFRPKGHQKVADLLVTEVEKMFATMKAEAAPWTAPEKNLAR